MSYPFSSAPKLCELSLNNNSGVLIMFFKVKVTSTEQSGPQLESVEMKYHIEKPSPSTWLLQTGISWKRPHVAISTHMMQTPSSSPKRFRQTVASGVPNNQGPGNKDACGLTLPQSVVATRTNIISVECAATAVASIESDPSKNADLSVDDVLLQFAPEVIASSHGR